jgi:hypothetical protein
MQDCLTAPAAEEQTVKSFVACHSPTEKFSAVVIATGAAAPQQDLDLVAADLKRMRVRGQVVFDLLTANGTQTRRFFAIPFDGERFPRAQFQRVEGDEALRSASARFFAEHQDEVDLALLTPALRQAVRQGSPL